MKNDDNRFVRELGFMLIEYDKGLHIMDVVNPCGALLLQHKVDSLKGASVDELEVSTVAVNREQAAMMATYIRQALHEKRNLYFEYSSVNVDEQVSYAGSNIVYMHGEDRVRQLIFEIKKEDIHKANLLQETENDLLRHKYDKICHRNHVILESLPVGVILYSAKGDLEYLNDRTCEIFGVVKEKIYNRKINIDNNPGIPAEAKEALRNSSKINATYSYNFDLLKGADYYTRDSGVSSRQIECIGTPVMNPAGKVESYVFIVNDITDLVEMTEAKNKAEELDRLKSAFISNMSHEVRTPLNAIVGFSNLLIESEDADEKKEFIQIIKNNNELLLQLVSDILDLSKIEAGKIDFFIDEVDVNRLCEDIIRSMQIRAAGKVKLIFEHTAHECHIQSDKRRLSQILLNFMTNALKFTFKGSITLGFDVADDKMIRFYVRDTGIGIAADKIDSIFDRFVKLDNFSQGTGLGLPICKSLVRRMSGEIGVNSTEGEGSEFWFTTPLELSIPEDM